MPGASGTDVATGGTIIDTVMIASSYELGGEEAMCSTQRQRQASTSLRYSTFALLTQKPRVFHYQTNNIDAALSRLQHVIHLVNNLHLDTAIAQIPAGVQRIERIL